VPIHLIQADSPVGDGAILRIIKSVTSFARGSLWCVAGVGALGMLSFFSSPDSPEKVAKQFASMFTGQDAAGIQKSIHPDVAEEKEIRVGDVDGFLKRYHSNLLKLDAITIDKRLKSEDNATDRFEATLTFRGPRLSPDYEEPSTLKMTFLWVLEDGRWWLERPTSLSYFVNSKAAYPTAAQEETALRFETTLQILQGIGFQDDNDLALIGRPIPGNAAQDYKELEQLHAKEWGAKGIDPTATGVQVFLKAAGKAEGGLMQLYHGDFKGIGEEKRKPVPWEMFRDYAQAAIKYATDLEKRGNPERAEKIYRLLISLGRQFLNERGGFHFKSWGLTFQKQGAEALARCLPSRKAAQKKQAEAFVSVVSRRLDLLHTALSCLDDMADYRSLKAAVDAANRADDLVFRPWGLNTLLIFALKGAPGSPDAIRAGGGMVLVDDPAMREIASKSVDAMVKEPSGTVRSFIESQKQWISSHRVYEAAQTFR
jgi:hypothetical protein